MAKRAPDRNRLSKDIKRRQISPRRGESKKKGGRKSRQPQEVTIDDLKSEYSYVLKDLRRIFILAGVMFLLLIAANILFPVLFA